jgi:hypothetical protein
MGRWREGLRPGRGFYGCLLVCLVFRPGSCYSMLLLLVHGGGQRLLWACSFPLSFRCQKGKVTSSPKYRPSTQELHRTANQTSLRPGTVTASLPTTFTALFLMNTANSRQSPKTPAGTAQSLLVESNSECSRREILDLCYSIPAQDFSRTSRKRQGRLNNTHPIPDDKRYI